MLDRRLAVLAMDSCPSSEELRNFLVDGEDSRNYELVAAHINNCQECLALLEQLTGEAAVLPESPETGALPSASFLRLLKEVPTDAWLANLKNMRLSSKSDSTSKSAPRSWPTVPDFEILAELGHGGMGIVYKARQISLNRLVALKMVLAGPGASESMLARFRNEAEAAARLQHANIVQIFSIGDHEGRPFLTLELVEGETLAQRLDETPQRPIAAAALVEVLARAIQIAHENRDLKPSNILLKSAASTQTPSSPSRPGASRTFWKSVTVGTSGGTALSPGEGSRGSDVGVADYGVPKIADFGLAKLLDDSARLTHTGDLLGTPRYMAPEQAMFAWTGSREDRGSGAASDIYSLGAILYEMITGQPPFKADTAMKTLLKVLHQDPVSPNELQPKVPYDLATITLKCLEKESSKRYETALDLAEDLRRFRQGEPILAQRIGPLGVLWRRCRRYPVMAALIGALIVSFVGGFVATAVSWFRAETHRRSAERHADRAESSLYLSRFAQAQLEWRLNNPGAIPKLLNGFVPRPGEPDRRGWEWYCLINLIHSDALTIELQEDSGDFSSSIVSGLRFSEDGRRLLVGTGSHFARPRPFGEVSVWGFDNWYRGEQPIRTRLFHETPSHVIAMTADRDGRIIAFGGQKGLLKIWDTSRPEDPIALSGHTAAIRSLSLSRDGNYLAAADDDGHVTVTDVRSRVIKLRLKGTCVRLIADGRQVITGDEFQPRQNQFLEIRDGREGRLLRSLPVRDTSILSAPFELSDDERQAVIWKGLEARTVNLEDGRLGPSLPGHSGEITHAVFSPDGMHVATAAADRTVRLWDPRTGAEELVFRGHRNRVATLAFHPNGRLLASGDQSRGEIKVWDLTRHPEYLTVRGLPTVPRDAKSTVPQRVAMALGFTADSHRLIEVRRDGTLADRDARGGPGTGRMLSLPISDQATGPSKLAAFSADGTQLAGMDQADPSKVVIWDVRTGGELKTFQHSFRIVHIDWSLDGQRIVTATPDRKQIGRPRTVKVWDTSTGANLAEFRPKGHFDPAQVGDCGVVALSPDGKLVAFDDYSETRPSFISIYEVASRRLVSRLVANADLVSTLAFSPSGALLAAGSLDGRIFVYNLNSSKMLYAEPLRCASPALGMLAFSPDGRLLAAAGREQLEVWHIDMGQPVFALRGAPPRRGDNAFNPRVAWSPDGQRLAALNHNHKITIWDGSNHQSEVQDHAIREERAFAWHLAHAQLAVFDPQLRFAADFHLRALADLKPPSEELLFERAILYGWIGQWRLAADELAKISPSRHLLLWAYEQALVQLQVNDVDAYRRFAAELRERYGNTRDPLTAEILAHIFQLVPRGLDDPQQLIRWSQLCYHPLKKYLLLGASYYRMGRYQDAVSHLQKAVAGSEMLPAAWMFLAMSYAQQGQVELARDSMRQIRRWLADQRPTAPDRSKAICRQADGWQEWLEVQILLREAKDLLPAIDSSEPPR
jgi:WD40 repeat protein/serine/threonine protein kinase